VTIRTLAWLCLLLYAMPASAGDRQRESDYARAIEQTLTQGQLVWLKAGDYTFAGLFTEAEKADNTDSAIVLHDSGDYPDQRPLIHGLRTILPQHGWSTLSIQMPLREVGANRDDYFALFDEADSRIRAAVEYLRAKGAKHIALVGYGTGAAMAAYALSLNPDGLFALAAISLPLTDSSVPQAQTGEFIKNIALPVLDIYAEFDLPEVADTARKRRMLGKDNPVFRQVKINGESHTFQHDPGLLIKRIYSWLTLNLNPNI